jgi:hypothetical protein
VADSEPSVRRAPTHNERGHRLVERINLLQQGGGHFFSLPLHLGEGRPLNLLNGVAQPLAGETERIALERHPLGEVLELGGCLEARQFAGLDCQHVLNQLIVRRDEKGVALPANRQPQRHGQWCRDRHDPHPQAALIAPDDLGILLKDAVDPVEHGVVFDLEHEDQARLPNLEGSAIGKIGLGL